MRSEGFPKRFCFRRWVEGPLEGMMALSADAEAYKGRAQRILAFGSGTVLAFLIILTLVLIFDAWRIVVPFFGYAALPGDMTTVLSTMALTVVFMALAFFCTLLLIQILRYVCVMLGRFENVEDLLGTPREAPAGAVAAEEKRMPGPHFGPFNILGASSSFTKDIVRNMPQVCRQMKFVRAVLTIMPLYYLGLRLGIPLATGGSVFEINGMADAVFDIILITLSALSVIAGLLVLEAGRFMETLYAGLMLVDGIRNAPMPKVPGGATPSERLRKYLEGKVGECKADKSAEGFAIHHVSDDCLLLAIETVTVPNLEMVKGFAVSCKKVLDGMPVKPANGRFVILYAPDGAAEDIDEEVEAHILANPIILGRGPGGGNAETVIQIMIEESGTYGMFPFAE